MIRFIIGYVVIPLILGLVVSLALSAHARPNDDKMAVKMINKGKKDKRQEILAIKDEGKDTHVLVYACGTLMEFIFDKQYIHTDQDEVVVFMDRKVEEACR